MNERELPAGQVPVAIERRGLTFRDVVFTIYRRKWAVLVVALPIIIIGGVSLFRQTGSFTASSKVVVELVKVDLPVWNVMGRSIDYDRELSTLFTIAMSLPVIEAAAEALEDSVPRMMALDPALVDLDKEDKLLEYLHGNLDVSVVGESSILEFQFTAAVPEVALMSVGALRDAFVEYHVHGRKDVRAIAYYEEQIEFVRGQIDSLLVVRTAVLQESGYSSLEDELRYDTGQLADLEGNLRLATTQRRQLETLYNRLRDYLDGDPRDFPMGEEQSKSHTLNYWRDTVSKREDELNGILAIHTEESLPVKRQRQLLERSLQSLKIQQMSYVESLRIELAALVDKENTLTAMVEEQRVKNSRAPAVYQHVTGIDTELVSLRGLLSDLQGKLGEVRISQLADERVSSVAALTAPELLPVFSGGRTMAYFSLLCMFSIALGLVAAFIAEALDHRVLGPRDIEDNLRLPVYGSVSRTD